METQLAALQSAAPAQQQVPMRPTGFPASNPPPPSIPASTNADAGDRVRMIKLPDPPVFDGSEKDQISYDDWYLQMQNTMQANEALMPTDLLNKSYLQKRTSGNAFAQLRHDCAPMQRGHSPR